MIKEEQDAANGFGAYIHNHDVSEQPGFITEQQLAIMDYLFKEVDLDSEDDFRELGLGV